MTISTTNAIRLSDIQSEFGGINPISMSEYYANGTSVFGNSQGVNGLIPSSGANKMSNFRGATKYNWIATMYGGGWEHNVQSIAIDSAGNVWATGFYYPTSTTSKGFIIKYNSAGTIQFFRQLDSGTALVKMYGIALDSSDNAYICGFQNGSTASYGLIVKYNSSGTLQWQTRLGSNTTATATLLLSIAVDSSGVYVTGTTPYTGNTNVDDCVVVKYNTSGVLQWQRVLSETTNLTNHRGYGIALDSSSNVYVTGPQGQDGFLAKYNSSGTIQYNKKIYSSGGDNFFDVAVDSSGNIFLCGIYNPSAYYPLLIKLDSSANILWQKHIVTNQTNSRASKVKIDSSGNAYVAGTSNSPSGAGYSIFVSRFSSSGNLDWQRTIYYLSNIGYAIGVDSKNNVYVGGYAYSNQYGIVAKLPGDTVSMAGTYGNYVVADTSFSATTSSYTVTTGILTDSACSLATSTGTISDLAGAETMALIKMNLF